MESLEALGLATVAYRQRLSHVGSADWDEQSVCEGWTVRDLADHVVGGNRFAVALLRGDNPNVAFEFALGLGFDDDPVEMFDRSAAAQIAAFSASGALTFQVHHPDGDTSAATFLGFRILDLVLHGWDLARSTAGDEMIDPSLADEVWPVLQAAIESGIGASGYGTASRPWVHDDTPTQCLLAASGRKVIDTVSNDSPPT